MAESPAGALTVRMPFHSAHRIVGPLPATHGETDGDVTRDEIPLGLQAYVQQYFAEVRKAGGPAKPKADAKQ